MSHARSLLAIASAATVSLLALPAAAGEPMLRLTLLVRNDAASPTEDPSQRCVNSWARATVSAFGSDRWRIRKVAFVLAGRPVSIDETTPYQRVIRRRDLEKPLVRLVARVEMRDGRRAILSRSLRRC